MEDETIEVVTVSSKWCPRCLNWKTVDNFYRNKATVDGCQAYCKECFKSFMKEPHREVRRAEYNKKYQQRPDVIEKRQKRQKEYHKNEDVQRRHKAALAVNIATRNGTLPHVSNQMCQIRNCNSIAQEYHHWAGYNEEHWLDVLPICIKCHRKL